jgi:hypothetical protein
MGTTRPYVYREKIKISRSDMGLLCAGRKRCTIRIGTAAVATGEILMTDGRKSIPVRILKVDNGRCFNEISLQDAVDEGFESREELIQDLRHYYPRTQDADPITVIYFEPIGITPSLFG